MRCIAEFKDSRAYGSPEDSLGKEIAILENLCANPYPGLPERLRAEKFENPQTTRLAEACAAELEASSAPLPVKAKKPAPKRRGR